VIRQRRRAQPNRDHRQRLRHFRPKSIPPSCASASSRSAPPTMRIRGSTPTRATLVASPIHGNAIALEVLREEGMHIRPAGHPRSRRKKPGGDRSAPDGTPIAG
jgi:hypothetical protein